MKVEVVSKANIKKNVAVKIYNNKNVPKELAKDKWFQGNEKECVVLRNERGQATAVLLGLGDLKWGAESVRQAAACLYKALLANKCFEACLVWEPSSGIEIKAFVEGFGYASYEFNELKSKKNETPAVTLQIQVEAKEIKAAQSALKEALILVSAVNSAKRMGDLPGNYLTPTLLAKEVQKTFKNTSAKVTVWDKKRIEKEKMGGLLAVARGSSEEPRFIIVEYKGKGVKAKQQPLVFVGKGLTFDTGGISIKPSAGMEEMKFDMCGAGAVIGAMQAIVQAQLPVYAIGIVASTENMPGASATKPGDVYVARNGLTVEVNNTDAEGRLILGDALVYASELKPSCLIDAATLTGAMVVALGNIHTGYFTRNQALKNQVETAATQSGELVWNMPLCDYHVEDMKGIYADLSNISSGKGAGSATAAAFLEQFVGKDIPWAHFDIAGTGWAVGNRLNYSTGKGASGVMVRTFFELAKTQG